MSLLKGLSQDQQDALMQSVLGKSDGTNRKTDSQLNTPETVQRTNDRTGAAERDITNRDKTVDGRTLRRFDEDPELRAGDTVLIDLTPVELALKDSNATTPAAAQARTGGTGAAAGLACRGRQCRFCCCAQRNE